MKVKFWGCRGSIPVPDNRMMAYGGNTTCIEVSVNDRTLIIDVGTGARKLGEDLLNRGVVDIDLFLTHSHWDHIQGFPFFKPIYSKKVNISIHGCTNSYQELHDILAKQMSREYFPVRFTDLNSKICFVESCGSQYVIGGCSVKTIRTNHPIYTVGLRIEDKGASFVFLTDNELRADNPQTSWREFVDFCEGADLLVHDAQFTDQEYEKRRGWGHSSYEQVIQLAREAHVQKLGFFHHDPNREDDHLQALEESMRQHCMQNSCFLIPFAVKEQSMVEL